MSKFLWALLAGLFLYSCAGSPDVDSGDEESAEMTTTALPDDPNRLTDPMKDNKYVVYQVMTRLFGNKVTTNTQFGTYEENGVGKFSDFTDKALQEIKALGVDYVWFTGILEHATMDDWTSIGIAPDDSDVIKGRAGSPYAIKDYYDVNPVQANNPQNRMKEFEALVARTHQNGLKVIIDFVPNHVARRYISDAKPAGVKDLGAEDDTSVRFASNNNFYYIPDTTFSVPRNYDPLGAEIVALNEDGKFDEVPAKATGNDKFAARPSVGDWFETVKLNYGKDTTTGKNNFDPIPSTWVKMKDILVYWAQKKVDGFRCDMAEMVPVEFWAWAIPQVKAVNPKIQFIAEIYNPNAYRDYVTKALFDVLYDKVGMYDTLKPLVKGSGNPKNITSAWRRLTVGEDVMLRFLENHDEERLGNKRFAGEPEKALGAMVISSTLGSGPVLIYFGQEVGEPGVGKEGFGGEDARTTIFDYWGVPAHQRWMNGGAFDGGALSVGEKALRSAYSKMLNLARTSPAVRKGGLYDLDWFNRGQGKGYSDNLYAYIRTSPEQKLLFLVNFDHAKGTTATVKLPPKAWEVMGLDPAGTYSLSDLFLTTKTAELTNGESFTLELAPSEVVILELK